MNPTIDKIELTEDSILRFTPNGDRYVVALRDIDDTISAGGFKLVRPEMDDTERGWKAGEVLCVGNGHRLETDVTVPMFFKPGDVLAIERLTGREIRIGAKKYLIVNQVDILGKIG